MKSRTLPSWPAVAVLLCVLSLALWNGDGAGGAPAEARNPDGFALNEWLPERSNRGVTDPEQFVGNAEPGAGRPEVAADGANAVAATVDHTSVEKALRLTQDDKIKIQRGLGLLGGQPESGGRSVRSEITQCHLLVARGEWSRGYGLSDARPR